MGTRQPSIARLENGSPASLSFLNRIATALDAKVEVWLVPQMKKKVTIATTDELLCQLREHPEWRDALRRELASEDMLALPGIMRELAEAQKRADERLAALTERVAHFDGGKLEWHYFADAPASLPTFC